jgi:hypothetical protein
MNSRIAAQVELLRLALRSFLQEAAASVAETVIK